MEELERFLARTTRKPCHVRDTFLIRGNDEDRRRYYSGLSCNTGIPVYVLDARKTSKNGSSVQFDIEKIHMGKSEISFVDTTNNRLENFKLFQEVESLGNGEFEFDCTNEDLSDDDKEWIEGEVQKVRDNFKALVFFDGVYSADEEVVKFIDILLKNYTDNHGERNCMFPSNVFLGLGSELHDEEKELFRGYSRYSASFLNHHG